jgi:beta-lactamase superfamily II metal-dependent hydrolase
MAATFTFVFVAMGQGDCCMVRCPDGKIVVVDCGRSRNEMGDPGWVIEAMMLLRDASWAGGNSDKIDALILTHPDIDHYNRVLVFFGEARWKGEIKLPSRGEVLKNPRFRKINVDAIYLSYAYTDNSPLGKYTGTALHSNIIAGHFRTRRVYEVTINSETDSDNIYRQWVDNDSFKAPTSGQIAGKKMTILNGVTDSTPWSVSIVAGNVEKGYGNAIDQSADEKNAKSLITLFEVGGRKALLCGDATFSTEKFLLNVHEASGLLKNVDLVQVPHHGSRNASGNRFVQMTNPICVVGSVGFLEHSHRLPRYDKVLERWLDQIESKDTHIADHDIDYWTEKKKGKFITVNDIADLYNSWTKYGKDLSPVESNKERTFYYIKNPTKTNDVIAFYKLKSGYGMFMFRESVNSPLTLTSQKTQVFALSSEGVTYRG